MVPCMKSLLRLGLLLCFLPFAAGAAPLQEVKLLTIGNSFADNSTAFLPQFAKAGGKKLLLFRANLGGHSLEQHFNYMQAFEANPKDPKGSPYSERYFTEDGPQKTAAASRTATGVPKISLRKALESQPWDCVTLQQVSGKSFREETYQPYANALIAYVHKYAPRAKILIQETWAYPDDYYPKFKVEGLDRAKMYAGLKAAYQKLSDETGAPLIRVGDAFQAILNSANPLVLNNPGDKHANANGKYLGGALFYEAVYQDEVTKVDFAALGVKPKDAQTLRAAAHATPIYVPAPVKH